LQAQKNVTKEQRTITIEAAPACSAIFGKGCPEQRRKGGGTTNLRLSIIDNSCAMLPSWRAKTGRHGRIHARCDWEDPSTTRELALDAQVPAPLRMTKCGKHKTSLSGAGQGRHSQAMPMRGDAGAVRRLSEEVNAGSLIYSDRWPTSAGIPLSRKTSEICGTWVQISLCLPRAKAVLRLP